MVMKSLLFFFAMIFLNVFCSFCQKVQVHISLIEKEALTDCDTIYYTGKKLLTWNDFKGKPVINAKAGAVTASGFAYNAAISKVMNDVTMNIFIYTFFIKHESWKKPFINDDYHLLHEQHHFDISRLGAEKFYDQLSDASFTINNYKKVLSQIFDKTYSENLALQDKYDLETEHSIKRTEQLAWNNTINKELKKLKN